MSYRDWHVGMKVVCIACSAVWVRPLVVGKIYTLRAIIKHPETDEIGVYLEEVRNDIHPRYGMERGYFAAAFRPIQPRETDISIFTAMLTGSKQKEPA
jgi:hypothetical protein